MNTHLIIDLIDRTDTYFKDEFCSVHQNNRKCARLLFTNSAMAEQYVRECKNTKTIKGPIYRDVKFEVQNRQVFISVK